jgi:uncharacterized membrane protein
MPDQPADPYEVAPEPKKDPLPFVPPEPIVLPPEDAAEEEAAQADAVRYRGPAILGYTIFLIPLLLAPKSRFARYHANQALLLFITAVIVLGALVAGSLAIGFIAGHVPDSIWMLASLINCGLHVLQVVIPIGLLALAIVGIVNAASLEKKPLPLIGNFTLIHEEMKPRINAEDKRG